MYIKVDINIVNFVTRKRSCLAVLLLAIVHWTAHGQSFDVAQMSFTFPRLYLAGGVTTLRTIEEGKIADLVLIDGNLTEDIHLIRKMEFVFKDGVGFDSKKLFESVQGKVGLY